MKDRMTINAPRLALVFLTLLYSTFSSAQQSSEDESSFIFAPYLWGTAIEGSSTVGALPPLDIDASFSDLFSNLNVAASLHTEFHVDKWAFVIDPMYVSLEMDATLPPALPETTSPKVDVDIWLVEAWASYQVSQMWELLGGARYQSQDIGVKDLPNPPLAPEPAISQNWTDWFIGTRLHADINENWLFTWRADVVIAGDSDTSWNTSVFFNRRIGQSMALNLGYRYFVDDFDKPGEYRWDVTQQGPVIGYTWSF